MDARAPVHQATLVRHLPERRDRGAHQQELRGRHACMRRHFQRTELHQAKPPGRGLRCIQLVDAELGAMRVPCHVCQQMAEHPIDQPGCHLLPGFDLRERDLQFRQAVLPRLVDARMLARRPDEQPAEQVRQARMVVPEAQQRLQQIGPAQERAVRGLCGAHHHVVAAAGADMAAVEHELLRGQPDLARLLVELRAALHDLIPTGGGMHVDLDHAWIRCDREMQQARIARRQIAFQHHLAAEFLRGVLDGGRERQPVLAPRTAAGRRRG